MPKYFSILFVFIVAAFLSISLCFADAPEAKKITTEQEQALAKMEAEIAKRIEEENKRPKKVYISPTTREVVYAVYYNRVRERIEKFGTLNFPQKNGKKLYGELEISVSIDQDGKIYDQDNDGVVIVLPSGDPDLDAAAKRIVRRAAPFGKFPDTLRTSGSEDVLVISAHFKFTNEEIIWDRPQLIKNWSQF